MRNRASWRQTRSLRPKEGMANLTLCLASILLTIAAVEGGLRIIQYGIQFRPTEHPGFSLRSYHVPDATNGYDINPDFPPRTMVKSKRTPNRYPAYLNMPGSSAWLQFGCKVANVDAFLLLFAL